MKIHDMTAQQCHVALGRIDLGRLACVRDNQPYIVPVHFAFDGQHLYGITTEGQKISWMRSNPLVCLEVEERQSHTDWMSIIVLGRYEELPDVPEFGRARGHALELLGKRTMWWEPACVPAEHQQRRSIVFYRIHINCVTGRRGTPEATESAQ